MELPMAFDAEIFEQELDIMVCKWQATWTSPQTGPMRALTPLYAVWIDAGRQADIQAYQNEQKALCALGDYAATCLVISQKIGVFRSVVERCFIKGGSIKTLNLTPDFLQRTLEQIVPLAIETAELPITDIIQRQRIKLNQPDFCFGFIETSDKAV